MTKHAKLSLAAICLLAAAIVLAGGSPAASQRPARPTIVRERGAEPQAEDPYANVGVLVEAYVVKVELAALYELRVSPLGQAPRAVSVENILTCLKSPEKATVITGTKASGVHRSARGRVRQSETIYRSRARMVPTREGQVQTVDYTPYESGRTFQVQPTIVAPNAVVLEYEFSYSGFRGNREDNDEAPPDTVSWSWNGAATVITGMPTIVGATQAENSAIFLILTARIPNRP
ncbi:MAG: hypothetical protein JW993_09125 [Sedimentisphaerales bacterium]|nr:hypothetical protein [Sedimentisphaerales bacterium]